MAKNLQSKPDKGARKKTTAKVKTVSEGNGRPVGTTRLSIKGQVVIPEAICKSLDLKRGDQFFVLADKDTICLRVLRPPTSREWAQLQELANLLMKGLSQPAAAA